MAEPLLAATQLVGTAAVRVLLVVGPSLGTAVGALWGPCAAQLAGFEVVGWDLPGHGLSRPAAEGFTVKDLAASVRALASAAAAGRPACYAGVSLGGAVAFELGLAPGPFLAVAALASASKIGEASSWTERAELVRGSGTQVMVAGSAQRWFASGFLVRDRDTAERLLQTPPLAESLTTLGRLAACRLNSTTGRCPASSSSSSAGRRRPASQSGDRGFQALGVGHSNSDSPGWRR